MTIKWRWREEREEEEDDEEKEKKEITDQEGEHGEHRVQVQHGHHLVLAQTRLPGGQGEDRGGQGDDRVRTG